MSGTRRSKSDIPIHVTRQNVIDGVAKDPRNCTFGQCAMSRENGMEFRVEMNPENPTIWVEWTQAGPLGGLQHHRGKLVRRHADGRETVEEPLTVIAATDISKKALLKTFPREGMDFWIVQHTSRSSGVKRQKSEEELERDRNRKAELRDLRTRGIIPPPKARVSGPRIRGRFGE